MLKCIIVEDQPPAQRILKKFINEYSNLKLLGTFPDAISAEKYLQSHEPDLIFLDIDLPEVSGLDFLKKLPNHPLVVMTTAFQHYALESYEYNVIDYLLKPFSAERFNQAISKLSSLRQSLHVKKQNSKAKKTIIVKSGAEIINMPIAEVIYIKSDGDYTEIHHNGSKKLSSQTLKQWMETLGEPFCQIHKSYIINIQHFKKVHQNKVHLSDHSIIPIGRAYKKTFIDHVD